MSSSSIRTVRARRASRPVPIRRIQHVRPACCVRSLLPQHRAGRTGARTTLWHVQQLRRRKSSTSGHRVPLASAFALLRSNASFEGGGSGRHCLRVGRAVHAGTQRRLRGALQVPPSLCVCGRQCSTHINLTRALLPRLCGASACAMCGSAAQLGGYGYIGYISYIGYIRCCATRRLRASSCASGGISTGVLLTWRTRSSSRRAPDTLC